MRLLLPLLCILCSFSYSQVRETAEYRVLQDDTTTAYATSTQKLRSSEFPNKVLSMPHLRFLTIGGMDCDYRVLDEQGNDITECWAIRTLPFEIGNLKELEVIDMPINNIRFLPLSMKELKKLSVINFTDNVPLSDVQVIAEIPSLEEAYFFGCNITEFPSDLSALKNLRKLGLTGNPISATEIRRIRAALPHCEVLFQ